MLPLHTVDCAVLRIPDTVVCLEFVWSLIRLWGEM